MKNSLAGFICATLMLLEARAQISLSSDTNYLQNFNKLPAATINTNGTTKWTNNITLPGWYARAQASGDYNSIRVSSGEAKNNGLYSFGSIEVTNDRALGSICSKSPGIIAFGVRLKNDTTNTLSNFTVSYTGEQWRISTPNAGEQSLSFAYRTSAAEIINPEPGVDSGWTRVPALDFMRLQYKGGVAALDGNKSENRTNFTNIPLGGLAVKPGEELFLRWQDVDDADQNDHGLAIDDLILNYTPAAEREHEKSAPKTE